MGRSESYYGDELRAELHLASRRIADELEWLADGSPRRSRTRTTPTQAEASPR